MRANGSTVRHSAKENSSILMVTFTKVNGQITKPMVEVFIPTLREPNMRVSGKTTSSMGRA